MYYIQNKYQDSGWEHIDTGNPTPYTSLEEAIRHADFMAESAILYGMVRVIDHAGREIRVWAAGSGGKGANCVTAGKVTRPPTVRLKFTDQMGERFIAVSSFREKLMVMQLENLRQGKNNDIDATLQVLLDWVCKIDLQIMVGGPR